MTVAERTRMYGCVEGTMAMRYDLTNVEQARGTMEKLASLLLPKEAAAGAAGWSGTW